MASLYVIKSAGAVPANKLFLGMFGAIDKQGHFQFDPVFAPFDAVQAYNFALSKGNAGFTSETLHAIDGVDEKIAAMKIFLMAALRERWGQLYQELMAQGAGSGTVAASVVTAAAELDQFRSDQALETLGGKRPGEPLEWRSAKVEVKFANANSDYDDDGVLVASASEALNAPLKAVSQVDVVQDSDELLASGVHTSRSKDAAGNFFHGTVCATVRVPQTVAQSPEFAQIVADFVELPNELRETLGLVAEQVFVGDSVGFSESPRTSVDGFEASTVEGQLASPVLAQERDGTGAGDAAEAARTFLGNEGAVDGGDVQESPPGAPAP